MLSLVLFTFFGLPLYLYLSFSHVLGGCLCTTYDSWSTTYTHVIYLNLIWLLNGKKQRRISHKYGDTHTDTLIHPTYPTHTCWNSSEFYSHLVHVHRSPLLFHSRLFSRFCSCSIAASSTNIHGLQPVNKWRHWYIEEQASATAVGTRSPHRNDRLYYKIVCIITCIIRVIVCIRVCAITCVCVCAHTMACVCVCVYVR